MSLPLSASSIQVICNSVFFPLWPKIFRQQPDFTEFHGRCNGIQLKAIFFPFQSSFFGETYVFHSLRPPDFKIKLYLPVHVIQWLTQTKFHSTILILFQKRVFKVIPHFTEYYMGGGRGTQLQWVIVTIGLHILDLSISNTIQSTFEKSTCTKYPVLCWKEGF